MRRHMNFGGMSLCGPTRRSRICWKILPASARRSPEGRASRERLVWRDAWRHSSLRFGRRHVCVGVYIHMHVYVYMFVYRSLYCV